MHLLLSVERRPCAGQTLSCRHTPDRALPGLHVQDAAVESCPNSPKASDSTSSTSGVAATSEGSDQPHVAPDLPEPMHEHSGNAFSSHGKSAAVNNSGSNVEVCFLPVSTAGVTRCCLCLRVLRTVGASSSLHLQKGA